MKTRIFLMLILISVPTLVNAQSDAQAVLAAFDKLVAGIEHANVNEVMSVYWNNPQLNLFNYNGTVTKGWEQVKKNRESSYPQIKDAKLVVRDKAVHMLGRDGAIVVFILFAPQFVRPQLRFHHRQQLFERHRPDVFGVHPQRFVVSPAPGIVLVEIEDRVSAPDAFE